MSDEKFVIDDDVKAEWAIRKIAETRADKKRLIDTCEKSIEKVVAEYKMAIERYKNEEANETEYLIELLKSYFATVQHKKLKTKETYQLPSGTLKLKYPTYQFNTDDKVLAEFLFNNNYVNYIEIVHKPLWGELKKNTIVKNGKVYSTETGEEIKGVTASEKPEEFELDI